MIHTSPSSLRVLPIARMMHHDLVIRVLHRAGCWRVLPHARADDCMYVSLKCAVYLDRRWGSWVLFRHSTHATLALAVRTHSIHIGSAAWFPMCCANCRPCHRPTVARLRCSNLRPTLTTANSTEAQRWGVEKLRKPTHAARVCMMKICASHDSHISVLTQSPARCTHNAPWFRVVVGACFARTAGASFLTLGPTADRTSA